MPSVSGQRLTKRGSSRSRYLSTLSSRSGTSVDESRSLAFADTAKNQQQTKQRAVEAWIPVYERAIASGNPAKIETAIRRSESFADAVGSQLAELQKTADRIAKYEMRRLHAQADANMKIKFEEDARQLKTRVAEWRRNYRFAKRQAREEGVSQGLLKAYLASNEFPHAVQNEREKMRAILDSLDVWWEPPRVFKLSLTEICSSGRVAMDASGVPDFFDHWLHRLEETGAGRTEGCFRVPGHQQDVMMLKKYYERDSKATGLPISQMHSKGRTCHEYGRICVHQRSYSMLLVHKVRACVSRCRYASLLKMWLRELTEPLIPNVLYDDAIAVGRQGPGADPRQLAKFLAKIPTANKRIVTRLSDFLKKMDVRKTRMDHTNLAIVFAPCFLRHDNINVFMANRDFEVEFTRRVIVYAGGEGSSYVTPATIPSMSNSRMPISGGVLAVPDLTPLLNPYAVPRSPLTTDSSPSKLEPAASSPTLAVLRRERSQSAQAAAVQAYEVEHQARLAAEAAEELADREEEEAAEELRQTEALIFTLCSNSRMTDAHRYEVCPEPEAEDSPSRFEDIANTALKLPETVREVERAGHIMLEPDRRFRARRTNTVRTSSCSCYVKTPCVPPPLACSLCFSLSVSFSLSLFLSLSRSLSRARFFRVQGLPSLCCLLLPSDRWQPECRDAAANAEADARITIWRADKIGWARI